MEITVFVAERANDDGEPAGEGLPTIGQAPVVALQAAWLGIANGLRYKAFRATTEK